MTYSDPQNEEKLRDLGDLGAFRETRPRLCWAPTSFQLTTELYPQELRQHGLALSHAGLPSHSSRWKKTAQKTCRFLGRHLSSSRCSTTASRLEHAGTHTFCGPSKATKPWNALLQLLIRIKFPQPWTMMESQLSDVNLKPCMPYSAFVPKLNDIIVPMRLAYVNIFKPFAQASPHHKCPTMPLFSVLGSSMKCASPSVSPPHSQHFTSFSHHCPMIFHHFLRMFPSFSSSFPIIFPLSIDFLSIFH